MLRRLGALLLVLAMTGSAGAETFLVSTSSSSGEGSLSQAVSRANALENGERIISFDRTVKNAALSQELIIMKDVVINGGGATIEGPGRGRLFTVTAGHAVFNRITFTNGDAVGGDGGAVKIEGTAASAAFDNCTFFSNRADGYGGAVCVTNGNPDPRTTLTHCTIAGNTAGNGGGFAILKGEAIIIASIIVGNSVSFDVCKGGGEASLTSYYNLFGSANTNMGTTSRAGCTVQEIFKTGANGQPALETVNGARVLNLSGTSIARDFISRTEDRWADIDEAGNGRPMLLGYDAGAVEALPVPAQGITIMGSPYIQINDTETYTFTITPPDASRNTRAYPPYGIEWVSSNPSVLSVDKFTGEARAVGVGVSYVTAQVHGWDADGNERKVPTDVPLIVTAGSSARMPVAARMAEIEDIPIAEGGYAYITPVVSLDQNGVPMGEAVAGENYELSAASYRLDIVTAEIVSGDTVQLHARSVGSCDVAVTATPLPEGTPVTQYFTVTVGDVSSARIGRSNGGGGCSLGFAGICALIFLGRRIRRNA